MAYSKKLAISCVYIITNLLDGKHYIGYTQNFKSRTSEHIRNLKLNKHDNDHLQNAWNKYGEENFTFEILEEYEPEFLPSMENWWANMLNVHNDAFGYNIQPTGPNKRPYTMSKKTKEKMKKSNKSRSYPKKKAPMSDETKQKLREINLGSKKPAKNSKTYKFSLLGDLIEIYPSLEEARLKNNLSYAKISACCYGKVPECDGFIYLSYKNLGELENKLRIINERKIKKQEILKTKEIRKSRGFIKNGRGKHSVKSKKYTDLRTGAIYYSAREVWEQLNINKFSLLNYLERGKSVKHDFTWLKIENR